MMSYEGTDLAGVNAIMEKLEVRRFLVSNHLVTKAASKISLVGTNHLILD